MLVDHGLVHLTNTTTGTPITLHEITSEGAGLRVQSSRISIEDEEACMLERITAAHATSEPENVCHLGVLTDALTVNEVQRIWEYHGIRKNYRALTLFGLMITAGLRLGGVANARIVNFTHSRDPIVVVRAHAVVTEQKDAHTRHLFIPPTVQHFLRLYLQTEFAIRTRGVYLFSLPSRVPHKPTVSSLGTEIKRILMVCGIDKHRAHAHALRKTCVTTLHAKGVPLSVISKYIGHVNQSTTFTHYFQPTDDLQLVHDHLETLCDRVRADPNIPPRPIVDHMCTADAAHC
jgi:integrase